MALAETEATKYAFPPPILQLMSPSTLPASVPPTANYRYYHDKPTYLPKETDWAKKAMFKRMLRHMALVPKANFCTKRDCACAKSHSYVEVMAYNPLYKRIVCLQPGHYRKSRDVQEPMRCVCIHVDTGVTWNWMASSKTEVCADGTKCATTTCLIALRGSRGGPSSRLATIAALSECRSPLTRGQTRTRCSEPCARPKIRGLPVDGGNSCTGTTGTVPTALSASSCSLPNRRFFGFVFVPMAG